MCQKCPKINPSEAAQMAQQYRTSINAALVFADEILEMCVDLEDDYRHIGLFYHTTEYETREIMAAMPNLSDALINLGDYFEMTEPAEYDGWASQLKSVIERASEMRSDIMHISPRANVESLVHVYTQMIYPESEDLIAIVENEREVLKKLATEVNLLRTIEMNMEERPRSWWFFNYNSATREWEMEYQGPEWETFVKWVSCLPETRKAMEQGQQLHDIARRFIRRDDYLPLTGLLSFDDGRVVTEDTE